MNASCIKTAALPKEGNFVTATKISQTTNTVRGGGELGACYQGLKLIGDLEIGNFIYAKFLNDNSSFSSSPIKRINFVENGVVNVETTNSIWQIAIVDKNPKSGDLVKITKISQTTDTVRGGGQLGTCYQGLKLSFNLEVGNIIYAEDPNSNYAFRSSDIKKIDFIKEGVVNAETANSVWQIEIL